MDLPTAHDLHAAIARALPDALQGYLDPLLIVLAAAAMGVLVRLTLIHWLRQLSLLNKSPYDEIVIDGLKHRVVAWTVLVVLYLQASALPWHPGTITTTRTILAALIIISVTVVLMRLVSALVHAYGTTSAAGVGGTNLIRYICAVLLLFTGAVSVLALFGISVVPAITALGVGGLAVALAFQDTLANVLSGLNLTLSRQIRVGDYIELNETTGGFVIDIGWRATTLRGLNGLNVFIPNKKLAEAVMTNYTLGAAMSVELAFRVDLGCRPQRIVALVVDEMRLAAEVLPGLRQDIPAAVRFKAFGEWALDFRVYVEIASFQDRMYLRHELMMRLHERLLREDIALPRQRILIDALAATPA
jgi:small-conductance mechanosensitive channel